jgi:cytochrome c biogenesis protein CcdA
MDAPVALLSALWLGILTSVSPCPLATNIAAVSYIGRRLDNPRRVVVAGLLYTLGRTLAYVALGALLVLSLVSAPYVSEFLQKYMNKILGPVLVVAGMFLLDLIRVGFKGGASGEKLQRRVDRMGLFGAVVLGVAFALSFCPVSAALFFGSLIPLAVSNQSGFLLPTVYGIGTALPVVVFAVAIALGARSVGKAYAAATSLEKWARRATGVVFVVVGIYLSLVNIFGLFQG